MPVLVPPSMALDPLLDRLQERGLQLAVVVDEYGGTAGIVTFEDLVEELVGDVVDDTTRPDPASGASPTGLGLSGLLRPDEIQAAIGLELPAGRASYETVAGLILQLLRRIPDVGDQVDDPAQRLLWTGSRAAASTGCKSDSIPTTPAHRADDSAGSRTDGEGAVG